MALPNPTIRWLFNGSAIKEGNPRLVKVAKTVLNLAGVTPEDIGSYTCHANNTFGKDIKTTFLSLISEYFANLSPVAYLLSLTYSPTEFYC